MAEVRSKVWSRSSATTGTDPVVLDIDASLVEIHSEGKEQAAPTYKGGFGFHPMFCFADATGEVLSGVLRPGNAGANTVADHVVVLDAAIAQLPDVDRRRPPERRRPEPGQQSRHGAGRLGRVHRRVPRRLPGQRNVGFFVTARSNAQVTAAIFDAIGIEQVWEPAVTQDGELRDGAAVCELTSLIDDQKLPAGTRLHRPARAPAPRGPAQPVPHARVPLLGLLHRPTATPVELDATMRAHAHVEHHIQRLKDSGLCRFPFTSFEANANWMMAVALCADLVRWFQLLCFDGTWVDARPKALRWGIFHAPGRLVHRSRQRVVRIIDGWPGTDALLDAYRRIALIT